MSSKLRELLKDAEGKSQLVITVNVDIRSFSPFSKSRDSYDVALFIKKSYIKLIEDYLKRLLSCPLVMMSERRYGH